MTIIYYDVIRRNKSIFNWFIIIFLSFSPMLKHKEQLLRLLKKIFFSCSPFIWLSPSSVLAGRTNKPLRHWAGLKAIRLMEHLSANHNPIFLLMKHYPLLVNLQQWDEAFGSPNKSSTAPERKTKEWYSNKMLMLKIHINLSVWDGGGECHSLTLLTLAIIKLDFINSWGLLNVLSQHQKMGCFFFSLFLF